MLFPRPHYTEAKKEHRQKQAVKDEKKNIKNFHIDMEKIETYFQQGITGYTGNQLELFRSTSIEGLR